MARIASITIPSEKRIDVALTYIYGIGLKLSKKVLKTADISCNKKTKELTTDEINTLKNLIEKRHKVEGDLRREKMLNIKRLKEINCYRGTRHARNLPARGQRTKTNSRTVRGNVRRTAGSGKRATGEKT